jgi:hypothetical protein
VRQITRLGMALLAVAAFGGTVASAAQAHEWKIKGQTLSEHGVTSEQLTVTKSTKFQFDFDLGGAP